ncbi:MAG: phage holin family protein [Vicinamibacterales bacterium]
MKFIVRLLLNGLAIIVASWIVPGLHLTTPSAAIAAGIFLGLVNALLRPLLVLLTLPLTFLSLGLFIFVINAACLGLAASVVPGFDIDGFVPALLGALIVSIVSWILSGLLIGDSK